MAVIEIDDVIGAEILFEQQALDDTSNEAFKVLLLAIVASIQAGEPLKKTKKIIADANINKDLSKNLRKIINEQIENITDEKTKIDFDEAVIAGYTYKELVAIRKNTTTKQAIKFMTQAQDILKDEKAQIAQLIKDEINKYEKSIEAFYRTQTKGAREFGYAENDKKLSKQVRGWISIAVLDNRTSAICISLHNKFYSKKDYATRFDVPYQIPRHPNCRSILTTVFEGVNITKYKGQKIDTFLKNNPKMAEGILGQKKYRIFKTGKAKINSFIDIKGSRFYTNDEIIKRLGIVNKTRLEKINTGGAVL